MADIPREPKTQDHKASEAADHEELRAVAKAGYQGGSSVAQISDAMKQRDDQRAERERQSAKVHYLGTPRKPQ